MNSGVATSLLPSAQGYLAWIGPQVKSARAKWYHSLDLWNIGQPLHFGLSVTCDSLSQAGNEEIECPLGTVKPRQAPLLTHEEQVPRRRRCRSIAAAVVEAQRSPLQPVSCKSTNECSSNGRTEFMCNNKGGHPGMIFMFQIHII